MRKYSPPPLVWILVFLSTACAAIVAVQRHLVESSNRAVSLVVDLGDARSLAAAQGLTVKQVLIRLQRAGATSVAVQEDTFADLLSSGRLVPTSRPMNSDGEGQLFLCPDPALAKQIRRAVQNRFPKGAESKAGTTILGDSEGPILVPGRLSDLAKFGVGLDRDVCGLARRLGLEVVARLGNPPGATEAYVRDAIQDAQAAGASGVIFSADQTLGWRDLVKTGAGLLKESGMWYGTVEFVQQMGDSLYKEEMLPNVVRVHSVLPVEMDRMNPSEAVGRYTLAASERNVRACYLRAPSPISPDPVQTYAEFVYSLNRSLAKKGLSAKSAHPFQEVNAFPLARFGVLLGVSTFVAWFGMALFARAIWILCVWFVVFVSAVMAGLYDDPRYLALLAALAFPTWAMLALFSASRKGGKNDWLFLYCLISGVSIVGGLHVAALLSDLPFMIQAKQFLGVKLAHFLPPLVVAVYLTAEQANLRELLSSAVRWGGFLLTIVVVGALGYMLIRTGNDAPSQVSGLELKLRSLLDRLLPVRPRTKEFLIGHPMMVLALTMLTRGDRRLLPLIGGVAAIGQVSMVNTFAHLHTPVSASALRVLLGLLIGLVLGWVVRAIYLRFFTSPQRALL